MNKLIAILLIAIVIGCSIQREEKDELAKGVEAIVLPRILGEEQGEVKKWYVSVGDKVRKGAILADLEMGDAALELESYKSGTILYIGAQANQKIDVGNLLAIVGDEGANIDSIKEKYTREYLARKSIENSIEGNVGEIIMFAGDSVPTNWRICDGSELKIKKHPDLYKIIKTKYGGDGTQVFRIPKIEAKNGVNYIICISNKSLN